MLTGELRNKIDTVWNTFWTGGISNPLTVIEQITYLLFIKRLDEMQTQRERKAQLTKGPIEDPIFAEDQYHLRWSRFKDLEAETLYASMTGEIFPFMKSLAEDRQSALSKYMKGATFMIPTPRLLSAVVDMLSAIDMKDRDTKGDVYEYLLSKIATAGQNGQFRTPRHIIKMMVDMVKPTDEDKICDPSSGTCGFLVGAGEYVREHHKQKFHDRAWREFFDTEMFTGVEFDATMIRIGAMNMLLHGIENPRLVDIDALSEENAGMQGEFSLILANPPFKGSLDYDAVEKKLLQTVKTKKTELLFLALMLRMLDLGGRCAVIVPDGVLFGSSKAHKAIRETVIEGHKLDAVISMPSGVFKPYAGVSTAILFFTRTDSGGTDQVWFYDMQADGYSLDDKRQPIQDNDIPDILAQWEVYEAAEGKLDLSDRTAKCFTVPKAEIEANNWDLSINRYKEIVYEAIEYDPPRVIIERIEELDRDRHSLLTVLKGQLEQL